MLSPGTLRGSRLVAIIAVHELVLCKPGRRPFIGFHECLDIVEQSIESLGGNLVFSRQFWGHDVTFSQLQHCVM